MTNRLNPEQKLKRHILEYAINNRGVDLPSLSEMDGESIDLTYDSAFESYDDEMHEAKHEIRASGIETGLSCDFSRHYESEAVATQMSDGTWIGWTYWHGGGKHGEPDAIDWMDSAYDLKCEEEQVMTIARKFSRE